MHSILLTTAQFFHLKRERIEKMQTNKTFKLLVILLLFSACHFSLIFSFRMRMLYVTIYFKTAVDTQLKVLCNYCNEEINGSTTLTVMAFPLHSRCFDTLDWLLWRIYRLQKTHLHIKIHLPVQLAEIYQQQAFLLTKNKYQLSTQHSTFYYPQLSFST